MNSFFDIDKRILDLGKKALNVAEKSFENIDEITEHNQNKVLKAFIDNRVSEASFGGSTGYGNGDRGRDTLEQVFAQIVGAEDAIFRHNFVSGTHTIATALFGVLRPHDTLLCVTGTPYDTLQSTLGFNDASGSFKEFLINYEQIDLTENGEIDIEKSVERVEKGGVKVVYIQRSRGYTLRPSLLVSQIGQLIEAVKSKDPNVIVMVDNCYGEFVETIEPTNVGADLIMGSLIKNAGGGIAPTGGYIAGRADLVEMCACRLTAPGIGKEVGATLGHLRELYMGLFSAPHVTGEALKSAVFASALFDLLGFTVTPKPYEPRADIIQTVVLGTPEGLISFCKGMQSGAPVDAYVTPEPWDMPGYDDKVIMAAGAFTNDASIELSADGPIREPFAAWMPGGLNFHSAKTGILLAAQQMLERGVITFE